jgi:DNA-binding NarL/FixJ family response regulator
VIVLASGNAAVRRRWKAALRRFPVAEIADTARLTRALADMKPSVALIGVDVLPKRSAAAVAGLQRLAPATRILVLSDAPTDAEAMAAFGSGARGYCHQDLDPALLAKAVEVVQKGEIWAGRTLVARLVEELGELSRRGPAGARKGAAAIGGLTSREREIAGQVAAGASNKEIAADTGVTERTVKAHLTAIFRKLGVSDRLRLAILLNGQRGEPEDPAPKSNLRGRATGDE